MALTKLLQRALEKPLLVTVVALVLAFLVLGLMFAPEKKEQVIYNFAFAERVDIVDEKRTAGTIVPPKDINLTFSTDGRIDRIYVREGDGVEEGQLLANLENTYLIEGVEKVRQSLENELATLNGFDETLEREKGKLASLIGGYSPEAFTLQRSRVGLSEASIREAKKQVVLNIEDAFEETRSARERLDLLFIDLGDSKEDLVFSVQGGRLKGKILVSRKILDFAFNTWAGSLEDLTTKSDLESYVIRAIDTQEKTEDLLNNLSLALDTSINPETPLFLLQAWKILVTKAKEDLVQAKGDVVKAQENLILSQLSFAGAEERLAQLLAGPTKEKIEAQEEVLAEAQSRVDQQVREVGLAREILGELERDLAGSIITAPMDGTATEVTVKEGDVVSIYFLIISLEPKEGADLEIEVRLREEDTQKIDFDDKVSVFVEEEEVRAKISYVDYRENKMLLQFEEVPAAAVAGMKVDINIVFDKKENLLMVPEKALRKTGFGDILSVLGDRGVEERFVKIGIRDMLGNIEILDGLQEGERVIIP